MAPKQKPSTAASAGPATHIDLNDVLDISRELNQTAKYEIIELEKVDLNMTSKLFTLRETSEEGVTLLM